MVFFFFPLGNEPRDARKQNKMDERIEVDSYHLSTLSLTLSLSPFSFLLFSFPIFHVLLSPMDCFFHSLYSHAPCTTFFFSIFFLSFSLLANKKNKKNKKTIDLWRESVLGLCLSLSDPLRTSHHIMVCMPLKTTQLASKAQSVSKGNPTTTQFRFRTTTQ